MTDMTPSGGMPGVRPNSSMALVSLITGILGLSLLPFIGSVAAVITGMMARREIRDSAGALAGDGLATAGLVLGWIGVGLSAVGLCAFGAIFLVPFCGALLYGISGSNSMLPALLFLM